jgi:hypothetical protein
LGEPGFGRSDGVGGRLEQRGHACEGRERTEAGERRGGYDTIGRRV